MVLDADGKLADVMLDELELSVSGGSTGSVTIPEDVRSKRTKGEDYPLAAASSLGKGWAEQADWFADYLTGRTPDEVKKLKTDENGKPQDADLVSGCTIAVDRYRDAVVRACEQAKALGAAQGDRVTLSLIAADLPQDLAATDDQDAHVRADITLGGPDRGRRGPGDQRHRGHDPAAADRQRGRYGLRAGRAGVHQERAGRQVRHAGGQCPAQGVVRARRGLLQHPEGQDHGGDRRPAHRRAPTPT